MEKFLQDDPEPEKVKFLQPAHRKALRKYIKGQYPDSFDQHENRFRALTIIDMMTLLEETDST
jgi:hypothetical protein